MNFFFNFYGAILGWFVWNIVELIIRQEELDEDGDPNTNFHFSQFAQKKKYYWIGSIGTCLMLLWIGSKGLNLDPLAPLTGHELGWTDLYYLGSGAALELLIFIVLKIRKITKKIE